MLENKININQIPGVTRIENCVLPKMGNIAMELTHSVYPHDDIYGNYCTLEEHINCSPEEVFEYLSDPYNLAEWTYSLRNFETTDDPEVLVSDDLVATSEVGAVTKIYTKTISNRQAMTVDFHCAWDQGKDLWMIYLMRVIPAQVVLKKPGSVVIWSNCHHPYYDKNPHPELTPEGRKVWIGDLWPVFYGGHYVEMQNLKHILEARHV